MAQTVTLAPAGPVTVQAGDTMRVVLYTDNPNPALPPGWTADPPDTAAMFGTRDCISIQLTRVATSGGELWPQVTLVDGAWYAWTWYLGQPTGPDAGYSWPQSGTVTAAG